MTRRHKLADSYVSRLFGAALAVGLSFASAPAAACGGFFCGGVPVVQAGEEILYVIDPDGSLTMSVRIVYSGEAPEFAWILPVPETPEMSLGTEAVFTALRGATQPRFVTTTRTEGTCRAYPSCGYPPRPDAGRSYASDAASAADAFGGVSVYLEATLGPYETVVIGGTSATEVHDWLTANGYDLPASAIPVLDDYVTGGQRFVALRLRNDATTSEIQPITLRFGGVLPCLPIRLTAIATAPDLPITGYFLADARATPRNYSLIEVSPPPGLWLGTMSYDQWVSNEADDMGGRAFIADYAGATPALSVALTELPALPDAPESLMTLLISSGYANDPQLLGILSRYLLPPTGQDPTSYYNCLARAWGSCGEPSLYDRAGLEAALLEAITMPRERAQAWLDEHAYTTRLYTTMSAEEMTLDPEFVIDAGLDDVSNVHTAEVVRECNEAIFPEDAASRLDLPDGTSVPIRSATRSVSDAYYCELRGGWLPGSAADPARIAVARGTGCSATTGAESAGVVGLAVLALGLALARRRSA